MTKTFATLVLLFAAAASMCGIYAASDDGERYSGEWRKIAADPALIRRGFAS